VAQFGLSFRREGTLRINITFKTESEKIKGELRTPLANNARYPLTRVSFQSPVVRFEMPRDSASLIFDGRLKDGMISGDLQQGETRGTFQFVRRVDYEAGGVDQYRGDYQLSPKHLLVIGRSLYDLYYLDSKSGRKGPLLRSSETSFFGGPSLGVHFPIDIAITFVRDEKGDVTGLNVSENGLRQRFAKKVKFYREEEVSLKNGDATLSGTLKLPLAAGPHPAMRHCQLNPMKQF